VLLLAAFIGAWMMLIGNHNVVVGQGEPYSQKDIRARPARLCDLTYLSASQSACFGDFAGCHPMPCQSINRQSIANINQRNFREIQNEVSVPDSNHISTGKIISPLENKS
jgi:hypothetical protein